MVNPRPANELVQVIYHSNGHLNKLKVYQYDIKKKNLLTKAFSVESMKSLWPKKHDEKNILLMKKQPELNWKIDRAFRGEYITRTEDESSSLVREEE